MPELPIRYRDSGGGQSAALLDLSYEGLEFICDHLPQGDGFTTELREVLNQVEDAFGRLGRGHPYER